MWKNPIPAKRSSLFQEQKEVPCSFRESVTMATHRKTVPVELANKIRADLPFAMRGIASSRSKPGGVNSGMNLSCSPIWYLAQPAKAKLG
jgi:hypothetical protein